MQGPHHLEQIGADAGVRLQVTLHVTAENPHIHNVFRQIFLLCQSFFEEPFRLFRCAEPHRGGVEQDGTFDTPSAAFAHAAPVLERIADQRVRRDRRDRLVEILHLDRGERNFGHVAVGAVFGHRDPVARAQHVVGRKLHAGHQSQDAVPENQHQHGGGGAQPGQDRRGVAADEDADHEDAADGDRQQLDHLVDALKRPVAQCLVFVRNFAERVQKYADEHQRDDDQVDQTPLAEQLQQNGRAVEGQRQEYVPHDRRNEPAGAVHDLVLEKMVVPCRPGPGADFLQCRDDEAAERLRGEVRDEEYSGDDDDADLPFGVQAAQAGPLQQPGYFEIQVFHGEFGFAGLPSAEDRRAAAGKFTIETANLQLCGAFSFGRAGIPPSAACSRRRLRGVPPFGRKHGRPPGRRASGRRRGG